MPIQKLDFLAVGDIVTDAFIELEDAWVETDNPEKNQELCMRFGDKIPYRDVVVVPAVGNSPNAAVSAHRLGLKTGLVTNLGNDSYGKEMRAALETEGVSTEYLAVHPGIGSNYHFVLRFKAERTILVKHHEYEYHFPKLTSLPKWLYLSSLAKNSLPYHEEIADFLEENPVANLAFQPGTFQMKLGYEKLERIYKASHLLFCNKEEAKRILNTAEDDMKKLLASVRALGPKIAVITDGPKGAYADDGNETWFMPMYPDPKPPVERTGAGDAFSSTFTAALALGKSIPEALAWGPINSMSVVQEIGAQKGLLGRQELEKYLITAPDFYKPQKI